MGSDLASGLLALCDELAKLNQRLAAIDQPELALHLQAVQAPFATGEDYPTRASAAPRAPYRIGGEAAPGVAALDGAWLGSHP